MKILITTGSWSASLVVMESLAKQGHDVYLLDHDIYSAGFHSKYCKGGILCVNEINGDEYVESIVGIIKSGRFDFLIPMSDFSTEYLSMHRERILPHVKMFLPSKELIELARYKDRTYRFALEKNIDIPRTYFPVSLRDVTRCVQRAAFPCVVKKPRGTANKGNAYFYDKKGLIRYYERLNPDDEWPVIQEYVYGEFYGFLAVAQEGELVDCVMFKTDQKYALEGTAPYCMSIIDEDFLKITRRIIKLLNWTGAINMDFLKDRNGQILLLEINPRISGSATFAYKLGVNLPAVYVDLVRGRVAKRFKKFSYKHGIVFRSVVSSELLLALKDKKYFLNLFVNFLDLRIRTDIPWDDPSLLAWELRHVWWYWRDTKHLKGNAPVIRPSVTAQTAGV
jgi:predicted ATP-grasp superfamily ATP-dependent carboligase